MTLAQNLAAAQHVVATIKAHGFAASNRRSDRVAAAGGIDAAVGTGLGTRNHGPAGQAVVNLRALNADASPVVDQLGNPVGNTIGQFKAITWVQVSANSQRILAGHVGNCWEQAQLALYLLYRGYRDVRPLDLMYFRNPDYDHVWVGVGLAPGWNTASPLKGAGGQPIKRYNLRNWGADAVWCDPWQSGGVAFSVADLIAGKIRNLDKLYKCNTAEDIASGWPGSFLRLQ